MNSDKFIDSLVTDLKPQKVWASPEKRLLIWSVFQMFLVLAIMILRRPLPWDQFGMIFTSQVGLEFILFLVSVQTVGYCAYLSLVPGALKKKSIFLSVVPLIALGAFMIKSSLYPVRYPFMGLYRNHCYWEVALLSLTPAAHFFWMAKKGLLTYKSRPLWLGPLASAMLPLAFMHVTCINGVMHSLKYHLAPTLAVSALSAGLAYFLIREN